jgi:4'-phosphopantetheinyl transferase
MGDWKAADMFAQEAVWGPPPDSPRLGHDEVHVWRVYLNQSNATRRRLFETLSADECARASRFYFEVDREAFIVGRGALREILGRYLGLKPAAIRFDYSPYGKPSLAAGMGAGAFQFNLSHSHRIALYALARSRRLGVDVELLNERHAGLEIAERFFSPAEAATLRALPIEAQTLGFFNCWTRKEAYIKALGEGLSHPLQSFTVSLKPGMPAALLEAAGDPLSVSRWVFRELQPGPLYVGALAVEGPPPAFHLWRWAAAKE